MGNTIMAAGVKVIANVLAANTGIKWVSRLCEADISNCYIEERWNKQGKGKKDD